MSARILIVDDNKINLKLLSAKLARDFYAVTQAENGPEALAIARKDVPDLILLDVMMPEMDGFEVCTRLKADPVTQHIPVVMISALSDVADRVRGLESGADDFLNKPINDMALFARVRSLLRLKMIMDEWRLREATAAQFALPAAPEEVFDPTKSSILIWESDAMDREAIMRHLSGMGPQLALAGSPEEVIEKTASGSWDLVMLGMDDAPDKSLYLCAQLRARESTRTLPLLLIAHEGGLEAISRGLDLGANDYLMRPIEGAELKARTRTQLRQKHHYDQLHRNYEHNLTLALVDPLTGAYNRRYLDMHLPMLFGRCKMTRRPLSALAIDLDHFKSVNDTHGHSAGDCVLREVINRVLISLRPSDLVVRMGGEEFSVIMPETDYATALSVGERLREAVASAPIVLPENAGVISVTASFGVAALNHENDTNPTQLLERADAAVYRAKETGRNKVVGE